MTYFYRKEKTHWQRTNTEEPWYPIKEMWDGTRFAELSWFWDPNKHWLLPMRCVGCKGIIPTWELESCDDRVTCKHCDLLQEKEKLYAVGDPRNIALILHWDGFSPGFGDPGKHSTGNLLDYNAPPLFIC